MPLIANGKTYSSGRAYLEDVKKKKAAVPTSGVTSPTPYTLEQLSKDINSGAVTTQAQLDTKLQTQGYKGNTEQNRVTVNANAYGGSAYKAPATTSATTSRYAGTGINAQSKAANSSGARYGSVGTNTMGTSYGTGSSDKYGLGLNADGRPAIVRNTVDRTAGIPQDPMAQYLQQMQQLNPATITDQLYKERRGQLDAIRQKYSSQVATEQAAGQEDLSRMRSMNLRAGLGGSDFGAANKIETRNQTNKNVAAIQANEDIEIGNAMNNIEQLAQARFQMQQQALQQGFTNSMQYEQFTQQQQQQARAQAVESIAQLGKSGLDITSIKQRDPQLYESLLASSGMGDIELEAVLNNNRPAPAKVDYKYEMIGNRIVAYGVDPNTGQLRKIEQSLDFEVPQDMTPTFAPDGTMIMVPKQFDMSRPANEQVQVVGNFAKPQATGAGATSTGAQPTGLVDANGKPLKLTATQTDALSGFDNTAQASKDALTLLSKGVSTGPIAGRAMGISKLFGNTDPTQLKLEQLLGKIKADFMKAMSGAAVSEQEVQRLSKFLPDMNDQEVVIESKLNTLIQETARSKQNLLNTLGAANQTNDLGVQQMAESMGYDYNAMRADGLTDEQILNSL